MGKIESLYTRANLRKFLNLKSNSVIVKLEKQHKLKPLRFGSAVRYSPEDIEALLGSKHLIKTEFDEANSF